MSCKTSIESVFVLPTMTMFFRWPNAADQMTVNFAIVVFPNPRGIPITVRWFCITDCWHSSNNRNCGSVQEGHFREKYVSMKSFRLFRQERRRLISMQEGNGAMSLTPMFDSRRFFKKYPSYIHQSCPFDLQMFKKSISSLWFLNPNICNKFDMSEWSVGSSRFSFFRCKYKSATSFTELMSPDLARINKDETMSSMTFGSSCNLLKTASEKSEEYFWTSFFISVTAFLAGVDFPAFFFFYSSPYKLDVNSGCIAAPPTSSSCLCRFFSIGTSHRSRFWKWKTSLKVIPQRIKSLHIHFVFKNHYSLLS